MRMRSLFGQFGRLFSLSSLTLALLIGATASLRAQSANDGEDVVREGVAAPYTFWIKPGETMKLGARSAR